jgi:RHS repeat-associated protein
VLKGRSWSTEEYRYGFNGKEKDDELSVDNGSYDFGARIYDGRLCSWFSLDPLIGKSISTSPYCAMLNSPLVVIDIGGEENIVYILVTEAGKLELNKNGMNEYEIAEIATNYLSNMGLKTQVRVFDITSENFDMNKIDFFDSVVIVGGNADDAKQFIKNDLKDEEGYKHLKDWEGGNGAPEKTENNGSTFGGDISGFDASGFYGFAFEPNRLALLRPGSKDEERDLLNQLAGLTVLHAMGHNAGLDHSFHTETGKYNTSYVMKGADLMGKIFGKFGSLFNAGFDKYVAKENNVDFIEAIKARYNAEYEPCDNYEE